MTTELSFKTKWVDLNRNISNYTTIPCYIERGYGKIPERLENENNFIIKADEPELIEIALQPQKDNRNILYQENLEEGEEDDDESEPIFWAVIYPQLDDE